MCWKKWWPSLLLLFFFSTLSGQEAKRINIKKADKGFYSKAEGKNRLLGNVVFEHEGALMYCDSAWLFVRDNRIRAFQKVRINQGDTLFLNGDYLEYSGETQVAEVTGKVVTLQDPQMLLTTDRLNLDRKTSIAYYTTGGKVVNEENTLTSTRGAYNSNFKMFSFKDSVVLQNPDYRMNCDTLDYDSESRIAYFRGPTTILSDSSSIYCENGWYNTITDIASFNKNARIYDGSTYLTGDSLHYEREGQYGEAFRQVMIHDTVENSIVTGDYGEYFGDQDSSYVTGEPLYTLIDEEQDSLHIHGDTLYTIQRQDTNGTKYSLVRIFYGVKIYRESLQGKCDSLSYSTLDSTFKMYKDPLMWDDSTQIVGDTIYLHTRNKQPDTLRVLSNCFMISSADSIYPNQVSGRTILGSFKDKELRRVYVNGNGQTVYYPKEEDGDYIGMNRSTCSNILIQFVDNKLKKITFIKKPEGKLYPMDKIPGDQKFLEGYNPRFKERPKSKADLFKP